MVALRTATVALVGNPNTGKTTLFNALAGMRQRVGNYPGVTVETKKGQITFAGQVLDLVDLPGTYSLAPRSPDEMVAVDLILGQQPGEPQPDVVVAIVDASNLERNLYLATQTMELGVPLVVALNMMDLAESHGMRIDTERLSRQRLAAAGCPVPAVEARTRYRWIREALAGCVARPEQRPVSWTDRLDQVLTHRVWGTLVFLAVMFLVFQVIFTWARPVMKGIS